MEAEHNCTVLQKIVRFATREAYEKHIIKYHGENDDNDVNGKVSKILEDGSLVVRNENRENSLGVPEVRW